MNRAVIHVTQNHIDQARALLHDSAKCVQHCCPIALALKDAGYRASVGDARAFVDHLGAVIDLPEEARAFIALFDAGRLVHPFAFPLSIRRCGS